MRAALESSALMESRALSSFSSSSVPNRPGTSPLVSSELISSRNDVCTKWWSSTNRHTGLPSTPAFTSTSCMHTESCLSRTQTWQRSRVIDYIPTPTPDILNNSRSITCSTATAVVMLRSPVCNTHITVVALRAVICFLDIQVNHHLDTFIR